MKKQMFTFLGLGLLLATTSAYAQSADAPPRRNGAK